MQSRICRAEGGLCCTYTWRRPGTQALSKIRGSQARGSGAAVMRTTSLIVALSLVCVTVKGEQFCYLQQFASFTEYVLFIRPLSTSSPAASLPFLLVVRRATHVAIHSTGAAQGVSNGSVGLGPLLLMLNQRDFGYEQACRRPCLKTLLAFGLSYV